MRSLLLELNLGVNRGFGGSRRWRPDLASSGRIRQAGGRIWRAAAGSGEGVTSSSELAWRRCRSDERSDGAWMGSLGPWIGSLGLSTGFSFCFCFVYSINRGGHPTASKKVAFTMTFGPRQLRCPPRLSHFSRFG